MTSIAPPGPPAHDTAPPPRPPAGGNGPSFSDLLNMPDAAQKTQVFGFSALGVFGRYEAAPVPRCAPTSSELETSQEAATSQDAAHPADAQPGATGLAEPLALVMPATGASALLEMDAVPASNEATAATDDETTFASLSPRTESFAEGTGNMEEAEGSASVPQAPPTEETISPFHLVLSANGTELAVNARGIEDLHNDADALRRKLGEAAAEYGTSITDFTFNGRRIARAASTSGE